MANIKEVWGYDDEEVSSDKKRTMPSYTPANFSSDTLMKESPMFYNDHSHIKRIFSHLSECRVCKLDFLNSIREKVHDQEEKVVIKPRPGIISSILEDSQLLLIVIFILIIYIMRK